MTELSDDKKFSDRELLEAVSRALRREAVGEPVVDRPPAATSQDERVRSLVQILIRDAIDDFLTAREINDLIEDRLSRIGLRIDRDHEEQTGEAMRGLLKYHKRADKFVTGIVLSILAGMFWGILKLLGVNLPQAPGQG